MERVGVDAVVDDVQLRIVDAEMVLDLATDHARIADHGAQPRAREHACLSAENVAMVGAERLRQTRQRAERAGAILEPLPMHAVAGAVDVAAREALMRLDEIETLARGRSARKAPVAPYAADMKRVAADRPHVPAPLPVPRKDGDARALGCERVGRARDEAL